MKLIVKTIAIVCGLTLAAASQGAPPPGAPSDANGLCKDGTYSTAAKKRGACKGHKGVKDWWAVEESKSGKEAKDSKEAKSTPAAEAPEASPNATKMAAKPMPAKVAAAGGGPGLVWVNTSSKVYHCQGDKWYGKTKQGEYMSEADATAKGFRADHGKACK